MVELDQMRAIRFRSTDILAFEDVTGKPWINAIQERSEKALVHFLWAGLKYKDEKLTPAKVSDILDEARAQGRSIADLWEAVAKGLTAGGFLPSLSPNGERPTIPDGSPAPSAPPGGTGV